MKSPATIGFPGGLIGSRLCFGFGGPEQTERRTAEAGETIEALPPMGLWPEPPVGGCFGRSCIKLLLSPQTTTRM